jgi:medium-chain acyl-[acyl-carrier-protein] hydrolase
MDEQGQVIFRCVSLWVLMDVSTRAMVLPAKSGVGVAGLARGSEIAPPPSLMPKPMEARQERIVRYTELDVNGHMNNTRYLDWVDDLLGGAFHRNHPAKEFTVCYLSEAVEGQTLELHHALTEDNTLRVDAHRIGSEGKPERVFSAQMIFE